MTSLVFLLLLQGDMAENGVSVKKVVGKRRCSRSCIYITEAVEENKFMASVKAIKELDLNFKYYQAKINF